MQFMSFVKLFYIFYENLQLSKPYIITASEVTELFSRSKQFSRYQQQVIAYIKKLYCALTLTAQ